MLEGPSPAADPSERELVFTRVFDAPPPTVFEAWSRPEHLANWWGPRGFRTTTQEFDFRPGGAWRHTMHGPGGTDYPNRSVFEEIVPGARIVYAHGGGAEDRTPQVRSVVTFEDEGGKTRLTMRMVFPSRAARDEVVRTFHAAEGGKETLERLSELLRANGPVFLSDAGQPTLVMRRTFDAPRRMVFEAWTKPEHVSRWFAPRPLTIPRCEIDFRPGGAFRLAMRMPDGTEFPMDCVFGEIVVPERIVFKGEIHGGNTVETTVTFVEHGGKTTLLVRQTFGFESDATRGARQGWTATLDQLGEHVAARS